MHLCLSFKVFPQTGLPVRGSCFFAAGRRAFSVCLWVCDALVTSSDALAPSSDACSAGSPLLLCLKLSPLCRSPSAFQKGTVLFCRVFFAFEIYTGTVFGVKT